MPIETPTPRLEWNEDNFAKVVADIYRESATDPALYARLLSEPFEVLSSRILVPEEYRGGIFAREKQRELIVLYVPPAAEVRPALQAEMAEPAQPPDYEVLCTPGTIW